jgi:uncharacterized hydrophobic protein (TIGR00271 family)
MLVHLRLTVPEALADDVTRLLSSRSTTNLVILPGVSREPRGDLIECDTAREYVSEIVDALEDLGLADRGGIVISRPASTPFRRAGELEDAAPGEADDAVIWDEVLETAEDSSTPGISYHVFLVMATALAAVAVITDSSVLVVGAMVVSPDFAPIAALCTGVVFAKFRLAWRSAALLVASFVFAITVVTALGLIGRATGLIGAADVTGNRPQTGFIWQPNHWSFIVALIAGTVGVLAMTTDKTTAMVGVFISVTTVPAAGNLALALATWQRAEITGCATQLGINLAGLLLAGTVTLAIQRLLSRHLQRGARRLLSRLP